MRYRVPKLPVFFAARGRNKDPRGESLKASLLAKERMDTVTPKGCLAVYVGDGMRRFVIPTTYLCLPAFRELMNRVAEEFGFENTGALRIPCDEEDFMEILKVVEESEATKQKKKDKSKE